MCYTILDNILSVKERERGILGAKYLFVFAAFTYVSVYAGDAVYVLNIGWFI